MTLEEALSAIYARVPRGMRLGLEPMREACARAGHPERAFETVHVAGTNGKGSVCAMVESALRAGGRATGLYTSPHLCRFAERIRLGGAPIDDARLARVLGEALALGPELSFFETATLAALLAFREAAVDVGVLEVGIGGRLDATNVIPTPRAAAITRIALDHTDRLGPTLVDIAREKAGIAKPGLELVLGPIDGEPLRALRDEAAARGATAVRAPPRDVAVALAGAHQRENAAVAWELAARAGASARAIKDGFSRVEWPARFERLTTAAGAYVLDAAHNPDGAAALARALRDERDERGGGAPGAELTLVFGALADKAWPEMLDALAPLARARVYAAPPLVPGVPRAPTDPHLFAARHAGEAAADVASALSRARALAGPGGLVVVAGSIFLVGEARALLLGLPRDPPVAL
jgi:dihydrofolate synthase / folylpolyglutamate synthase